MFLCDDCRTKYFTNQGPIVSHGPCEMCKEVKDCSDIQSENLINKKG